MRVRRWPLLLPPLLPVPGTHAPVDPGLRAQGAFSLWGGTMGQLSLTDEDTGFREIFKHGVD